MKKQFTTLNREPFIPMPFLFWKLSYLTFKYDLLLRSKKWKVKSSVQRLGQRIKYAQTSHSNSRASIGPYRMFVYQSIICLITNLQLKFLSQMTQKIMCIRSINNIHWHLLDFFSFKLIVKLKSKNSSTAWKISTVILWTMIRTCENILFFIILQ